MVTDHSVHSDTIDINLNRAKDSFGVILSNQYERDDCLQSKADENPTSDNTNE